MTGKRVGYIRVSSLDQSTDRQLQGVVLDKVYEEKVSGKDTQRPALQACLEFLREDDTLVVHSMDRLARNVVDLIALVNDLVQRSVSVQFVKNNLLFSADTANPTSALMLAVLGAFAQFERDMIRERQCEGIVLAKMRGVYTGRKPRLSPEQVTEIKQQLTLGVPKVKIARRYGISRATLYNTLDRDSSTL
jgi:DNA invertase Pin-like site-specific DNA recombinase